MKCAACTTGNCDGCLNLVVPMIDKTCTCKHDADIGVHELSVSDGRISP